MLVLPSSPQEHRGPRAKEKCAPPLQRSVRHRPPKLRPQPSRSIRIALLGHSLFFVLREYQKCYPPEVWSKIAQLILLHLRGKAVAPVKIQEIETSSPGLVLIVDDEPAVVTLIVEVLQRKGYRAQGFLSGVEAVALIQQEPDAVALLLTDLEMPRKTGVALIHEVKVIKPQLPIVVMSGDFQEWESQVRSFPWLSKPFRIEALLHIVEQHLGAG